jgi:hypothetical protein
MTLTVTGVLYAVVTKRGNSTWPLLRPTSSHTQRVEDRFYQQHANNSWDMHSSEGNNGVKSRLHIACSKHVFTRSRCVSLWVYLCMGLFMCSVVCMCLFRCECIYVWTDRKNDVCGPERIRRNTCLLPKCVLHYSYWVVWHKASHALRPSLIYFAFSNWVLIIPDSSTSVLWQ